MESARAIRQVPVVLFIFRRPNETREVIDALRTVKPERLYVVADGPRQDEEERSKCMAARKEVEKIDWDCRVVRRYHEMNQGGPAAIPDGLDWVFSQEDAAVILEDDCVPHPSFFWYCAALLDHYRDDERVMHISGTNNDVRGQDPTSSYYFSYRAHPWGWATWSRAWKHFRRELWFEWPQYRDNTRLLRNVVLTEEQYRNRVRLWDRLASGDIVNWDYRWNLTCVMLGGLSILPNQLLVKNIGTGADSTHTRNRVVPREEPTGMWPPLRHTLVVLPDLIADHVAWAKKYKRRGAAGKMQALKHLVDRISGL